MPKRGKFSVSSGVDYQSQLVVTTQHHVNWDSAFGLMAEGTFIPNADAYKYNDPIDKIKKALKVKKALATPENIWRSWFGHFTCGFNGDSTEALNSYLTSITPSAANFMLEYASYFDLGLDLDHLPKGFKITLVFSEKKGQIERHLDYDPFDNVTPSPIALTIPDPNQLEVKEEECFDLSQINDEIESFSGEQRSWWDALLSCYPDRLDPDQLKFIFAAFISFSLQIEAKKLSFYNLDAPAFNGIKTKNVQVLLGRMLSILNNAELADLPDQWKCITKLDLTPQGAIRAIQEKKGLSVRCRVVLPEMETIESLATYAKYRHDCVGSVYSRRVEQSVRVTASTLFASTKMCSIVGNNIEDMRSLKIHYFRAIAHEPNRLPISFYQLVFKQAESRQLPADKLKVALDMILVGTSGQLADVVPDDKSIEEIFSSIGQQETPYKALQRAPLSISLAYVKSYAQGYAQREPFNRINAYQEILTGTSFDSCKEFKEGGLSLWEGLKFSEDYEGFYKAILFLEQENKKVPYEYEKVPRWGLFMLRLWSTFNLGTEGAWQITCAIREKRLAKEAKEFERVFIEFVEYMTYLRSNQLNGVTLSTEHLLFFIEKLHEKFIKKEEINFSGLSKELGFTEGDFSLKPKCSDFLGTILSDVFKDNGVRTEIEKIFGFFELDPPKKNELILQLSSIQNFLGTTAFYRFLKDIQKVSDIFGKELSSKEKFECFSRLANEMETPEKIAGFSIFLNQFLKSSRSLNAFCERSSFFLSRIVPVVNARYSSLKNSSQLVEKSEIYALLFHSLERSPDLLDEKTGLDEEKAQKKVQNSVLLTEQLVGFLNSFSGLKNEVIGFLCSDIVNESVEESMKLLYDSFLQTLGSETLKTLFFHVNSQNGNADFKLEFRAVLKKITSEKISDVGKKVLFEIMAVLLNRGDFKADLDNESGDFNQFLSLISDKNLNSKTTIDFLNEHLKNPPYPSFSQILSWMTPPSDLGLEWEKFDLNPSIREAGNGFLTEEFWDQRGKLVSYGAEQIIQNFGFEFELKEDENDPEFKDDHRPNAENMSSEISNKSHQECVVASFSKQAQEVRDLSSETLRDELKKFRGKEPLQDDQIVWLISILAELMYRAQTKQFPTKPGETYELNTTQYLALYYALKLGGPRQHVTSEVFTGEGKTRLDILTAASQAILGFTVDFIATDRTLCARDFQKFQCFFKSINVPISQIETQSDLKAYRKGGVNFSTVSDIQLFRSRARLEGEMGQVLETEACKRSVVIAESDQLVFDSHHVDFNYAQSWNRRMNKMEWLYPALVDFALLQGVGGPSGVKFREKDKAKLREAFLDFVENRLDLGARYSRLLRQRFSEAQLSVWLDSVETAFLRRDQVDFDIQTRPFPQAMVKQDSRISHGGQFTKGVQPCLHALLNKLKASVAADGSGNVELGCGIAEDLREKLKACQTDFPVEVEKRIAYRSNIRDFLLDYQEGSIYGSTGSPGSEWEREQARREGIRYVHVPRHRSFRRMDRPPYLARDFNSKIDQYVKQILQARACNPSERVLIFEEDDESSLKTYKAIEKKLQQLSGVIDENLQRIDALSEIEGTLNERVDRVAQTGMVTVSTPLLARGMDKEIDHVLVGYLPSVRTLIQEQGRTGRFGKPGQTRMILDREELEEHWGDLNTQYGFFTSTDTFLARRQALMDRAQRCLGLFKKDLTRFYEPFRQVFWNKLEEIEGHDRGKMLEAWEEYLWKVGILEEELWVKLTECLSCEPDANEGAGLLFKIDECLGQHALGIQELRSDLFKDFFGAQIPGAQTPLCLSSGSKRSLLKFGIEHIFAEPRVYHAWDKALAGRSAVYDYWFAETYATLTGKRELFANTKKWLNREGELFAGTLALWRGERKLFANTRATLCRLYHSVTGTPQEIPVFKQRSVNGL